MRIFKAAIISVVLTTGFSAAMAQSAPPERALDAKLTKQMITGTWRLVDIDYAGPNGALVDPIFGPNAHGIIIYDQSGWMSVQIVTANRPAIAAPRTRTTRVGTPDEAKLAAAGVDSYYAYFGTWDYNAETSVITHHINSSLLPYETGLEYQCEIRFDGVHLKSIVRSQAAGEARRRTLVWSRISAPVLMAAPPAASVPQSGLPRPAREPVTKYGDMPAKYQEAIQEYFLQHLRNPDSVQYRETTKPEPGYVTAVTGTFLMSEKREYGWTVKATINTKNSHDRYVGFKTYTFLFRGEDIVDARLPLPGDEMK